MGTCSSVRQWQPGQRRSGLRRAVRQGALLGAPPRTWGPDLGRLSRGAFCSRPSGTGATRERRRDRGGVRGSPDPVVLRSDRLWVVLGLGGGGKARGVSGLNGKSPTLRGLLGTHVQAPGRSARGGPVRTRADRRAPPPRVRALGRSSPAGGRGQSQAGRSCLSPGRGRTLRSRRSRAGVCGACGHGRRGGGLHCDPGLAC